MFGRLLDISTGAKSSLPPVFSSRNLRINKSVLKFHRNDYAFPKVQSHRSITLDPLSQELQASRTDTDEEDRSARGYPGFEEAMRPPVEIHQPKSISTHNRDRYSSIKVGGYHKKQQMNELYRENNKIAQSILETKPSIDTHKLLEDFR